MEEGSAFSDYVGFLLTEQGYAPEELDLTRLKSLLEEKGYKVNIVKQAGTYKCVLRKNFRVLLPVPFTRSKIIFSSYKEFPAELPLDAAAKALIWYNNKQH